MPSGAATVTVTSGDVKQEHRTDTDLAIVKQWIHDSKEETIKHMKKVTFQASARDAACPTLCRRSLEAQGAQHCCSCCMELHGLQDKLRHTKELRDKLLEVIVHLSDCISSMTLNRFNLMVHDKALPSMLANVAQTLVTNMSLMSHEAWKGFGHVGCSAEQGLSPPLQSSGVQQLSASSEEAEVRGFQVCQCRSKVQDHCH